MPFARQMLLTIENGTGSRAHELLQLPQFLNTVCGGAQGALDDLLSILRSVASRQKAAYTVQDPPPHKLLYLLLLPEMDPPGTDAWCPPPDSFASVLLADCICRHEKNSLVKSKSSAAAKGLWLRFEAAALTLSILRSGIVAEREAMLMKAELENAISRWNRPRLIVYPEQGSTDNIEVQAGAVTVATARVFAAQLRVLSYLCLPGHNNFDVETFRDSIISPRSRGHNSGTNMESANTSNKITQPYFGGRTQGKAADQAGVLGIIPVVVLTAQQLPPFAEDFPTLSIELTKCLLEPRAQQLHSCSAFPQHIRSAGYSCAETVDKPEYDDLQAENIKISFSSLYDHVDVWNSIFHSIPCQSSVSSTRSVDTKLLLALITMALELAAIESQSHTGWSSCHWISLQQRLLTTIICSDSAHATQSDENERIVNLTDLPALMKLCFLAAMRAAASTSSQTGALSFFGSVSESKQSTSGDEEQHEANQSVSDVIGADDALRSWIQCIRRIFRCSLNCDPGQTSSMSTSSTRSPYDFYSVSSLDHYLEQILPSFQLVTEELQFVLEQAVEQMLAGYSDSLEDLSVTWHDAALILLLLRYSAPLTSTLASINFSGGIHATQVHLSSASSSSSHHSSEFSPSSSFNSMSGSAAYYLEDTAMALLPTELDKTRHLSILLLAFVCFSPRQSTSTLSNDSSVNDLDIGISAAKVLWRVLTLNGAEGIGHTFWNSESESELQISSSSVSSRKALLASQIMSIALSWVLAPHIQNSNGIFLKVPQAQSNSSDLYKNKNIPGEEISLADLGTVIGRSVLAMVFREAPETRGAIIHTLAGGALAVSISQQSTAARITFKYLPESCIICMFPGVRRCRFTASTCTCSSACYCLLCC